MFIYFNPRSPRGERRRIVLELLVAYMISIHALREESDLGVHSLCMIFQIFQSTLSARRATVKCILFDEYQSDFNPRSPRGERQHRTRQAVYKDIISIHALREESDLFPSWYYGNISNFNPRSPRGERLICFQVLLQSTVFQSTLSARRATLWFFWIWC